jgi:hypothetical protein
MSSLADTFARLAHLTPFGKRDDDPLANLKAATRWLDTLPVGDAFKCQEAILKALKGFNAKEQEHDRERLAVFMLLDERSRDLQDTLVRQYLRNPRMSRQVESQLWHAVYGLYWEIARGYHTFVLHMGRDANHAPADVIPLLTLRAIRTFGQLLKWHAIRYLPASPKLWLRLHNLYRISESGGFAQQSLRAYADDGADCSCQTAYLHIMMLNLANSGTLYPRQLDLLDRWLCGWHDMLRLEETLDPERHTFAVDLSADHGPRRVRKADSDKPMRFWDTHSLLQEITNIHAALERGGAPVQVGLSENARTGESLELLDYLLHHWASLARREQRRAPRELVKRLFDVTHGLNAIVGQIKAGNTPARVSPYGTGLDYSDEEADEVQVYGFITDRTRDRVSQMTVPHAATSPDVERWVMHDESECGYGAVVESSDKDWLRVGALIGVKSHDAREWHLAVIRRLQRVSDDTSSVGIETVSEAPQLTMLYDMATSGYTVNGRDNSGGGLPHPSLWLATEPPTAIIDPALFAPGKVFQVHGAAEHKFIALGTPVERCEGWMRVTVDPVAS